LDARRDSASGRPRSHADHAGRSSRVAAERPGHVATATRPGSMPSRPSRSGVNGSPAAGWTARCPPRAGQDRSKTPRSAQPRPLDQHQVPNGPAMKPIYPNAAQASDRYRCRLSVSERYWDTWGDPGGDAVRGRLDQDQPEQHHAGDQEARGQQLEHRAGGAEPAQHDNRYRQDNAGRAAACGRATRPAPTNRSPRG